MLGKRTKLSVVLGATLGLTGCLWDSDSDSDNSPPSVTLSSTDTQTFGMREIKINTNASDPDGDTLSYSWSQLSGSPQLDLSDVDSDGNLSLLLPDIQSLETFTFQVKVSDDEHTVSDSIDINADKSNPLPTAAIVGKSTIAKTLVWPIANQENLTVLSSDGSIGSNPKWQVVQAPDNSSYHLTSPNSLSTGFYADSVGQYQLELLLSNALGETATAQYSINVIDDIDGDGQSDNDDADADGDGYLNDDLFPLEKASHSDSNGDGISNYHEQDEDGDGTPDELDGFPFDASKDSWLSHTESANNNDGISVAETVASFPALINGTLLGANGYDQDYFRLSLPEGRVSIQLQTSIPFTGFISLVDASGVPVAFIKQDLPNQTMISAIIPGSNDYYLIVGADITADIDYHALAYIDTDQDGLPDDLENALDSNPLNADSDSDGLIDGVEFYGLSPFTADLDGDQLPSWWDLDSDNDLIADQLEQLNVDLDIDNDGKINSQDEDSDNNGQLDSIEVGYNLLEPLNTDGDIAPDFLDRDNDNDMINDELDSDPNTGMMNSVGNTSKPLEITQVLDKNEHITFQCLPTHTLSIELSNFNEYSDLKAIAQHDGLSSEIPYTIDNHALVIECQDLALGEHLVVVTDGQVKTGEYPIIALPENAPILSSVTLEGNLLSLHGENLNQPFQFHYTSGEINVSNNHSANAYSLSLPADFVSGDIYLDHAYGKTQAFFISYSDSVTQSVSVQLPDNIDETRLFIATSLNNEVAYVVNDTQISVDSSSPEIVSLVKYVDDELHTLGYGVALPNSQSVKINATTTAVGYLWHGINYDWSAPGAEQQLQNIYALESVQKFGEFIYNGISGDLDYLLSEDVYLSPLYQQAVADIKNRLGSLQRRTLQSRSSPIVITPDSEIDDISVKIDGDNQFNIENDTRLHLAFQVVNTEGKTICQYGSGMWSSSYVGPQETMWHIAKTGICGGSVVQDAKIRVLSAGSDSTYDANLTPAQISGHEKSIRQYLVSRTIIDGVVLPQLMFVLDNAGLLTISKSQLASIFLKEAPWFATEAMEFTSGGQTFSDFKRDVLTKLKNDFLSYGPITEAIFTESAKNMSSDALAKIAANAVKKAIPIIGQLSIVTDFALMGVDVGKTLTDLATVDVVIDFELEVELDVTSVEPTVINPDGESKRITIQGRGFQPVKPNFWSGKKYPLVTLTSQQTAVSKTYKPYYINHDGTEMWIMADASLFELDDDKIDVSVKHSAFDLPAKELLDAITVETDLVLSSVSKTQAASNDILTVKGSGFSKYASKNTVMFGQYQVAILGLSSTEISFRIPKDLDPGTYAIKAKRLDSKDSKWSNELDVEIAEADIVITVCDNGGLKDDNFALDVNGQRIGQTVTTDRKYCFAFPITLAAGVHSATLTGLDAPDGIGTYSIAFGGVSEVSGSPTHGSDLVPGSVPKRYTFKVVNPTARSMFVVPMSIQQRIGTE
ncbi:IPT/TIG domain-containing protein [Vibrio renipiscarius]|uniref:IPT/TIG domain-containing protein n=1 Tax=Vibrio renipiscarius TaxID=1461322 RepID=UPI00354E757D